MDERNALAELAHRIEDPIELRTGQNGCVRLSERQEKIRRKAQRIVAELAKVADWMNDYGANEPEPYRSVSAIKECRAIAEEGKNV